MVVGSRILTVLVSRSGEEAEGFDPAAGVTHPETKLYLWGCWHLRIEQKMLLECSLLTAQRRGSVA